MALVLKSTAFAPGSRDSEETYLRGRGRFAGAGVERRSGAHRQLRADHG